MELLLDDRSGEVLPPGIKVFLYDVLKKALAYASGPDDAEISVSLVTAQEIRILNREYRDIDKETDVLSFPFHDREALKTLTAHKPLGQIPLALGDIVLCPKVAEAQAETYNHNFIREVAFLAVHGLLHLLGYDHETPDDERVMNDAQETILQQAGILR
jgi:probable rRNA maturation factor